MIAYLVLGNVLLTVIILLMALRLRSWFGGLANEALAPISQRVDSIRNELAEKFTAATADMAQRLERTKGDLRQDVTDRIQTDFRELRDAIDGQLKSGREEQNRTLKLEIEGLTGETRRSLEAIRNEVDQKLLAIGKEVQGKLDQNIREGFQQFEKVQQHLQAAEEQLRNVNLIGASINDLNNLLKLPHLRGRFGEETDRS